MTFNLISDRWLPCRRLSGARAFFAPHDISSDFAADPIVALDFPRPDWNAAVMELLIGLLSVAAPPSDADDWARHWIEPPAPTDLQQMLAPLTFAFNLDGDGPRCFQDVAVLAEGKIEPIENLLMNAPADDNRDLFIKSAAVTALSRPFVAAALVALQSYAPGGGRGHMANPRKKGPLSCRLVTYRRFRDRTLTTLWDEVWPSVLPAEDEGTPDASIIREHLPWFHEPTSETGGVMTGEGRPHWALFFTQPRRIALEWSDADVCAFGESGSVCSQYRTRPKGHQYEAWRHPLSSYRVTDDGEWKCISTPTIRSYADWSAIWAYAAGHHPPLPFHLWESRLTARHSTFQDCGIAPNSATRYRGLAISGIVADRKLEAKVLGWLEERIPYYEPPAKAPSGWSHQFQGTIGQLVSGAGAAANALKFALRVSKFGKRDGDGFKLLSNAPKDAFDDVVALLWRDTEDEFVAALEALHGGNPSDPDGTVRSDFLPPLRRVSGRLFDAASNIDSLADQDAKRLVFAKNGLVIALSASGAVAQALGLAAPNSGRRNKRS